MTDMEGRTTEQPAPRIANPDQDGFLCSFLKPHFLFDALSVVFVSMPPEETKARELMLNLSELLRAAISCEPGDAITLEQEIELVRHYASIEMERFPGRFTVEYDLEDGLYSQVPAFAVQQLVSNALHHGVLPTGRPGRIAVSASMYNGVVRVSVSDDGCGKPEDHLAPAEPWDYASGLKHVEDRLRRIDGSGLTIMRSGKGTEVGFLVPAAVREDGR